MARVALAALVAAPALAVVVALAPLLPGGHKLWLLLGFGLIPLARAVIRRLGKTAQDELWAAWDGAPATRRLRWRDAPRPVVTRRHSELRSVLGADYALPTAAAERIDAAAADLSYGEAVRRLIDLTRDRVRFRLLYVELRNYNFARNLYGGRRLAQGLAGIVLVGGAATAGVLWHVRDPAAALPWLLPAVVSLAALLGRRLVIPEMVRAPAEAYADRLMGALRG